MDFTQRSDLDKLLDVIVKYNASDLHIGPGRRPVMRLHGKLQEIPGYEKVLTQTDMDHILEKAYRSPTGPSAVQAMDDLDFSYVPAISHERDHVTDLAARYRVNAVASVLGTRMVFRRLPPKPPALAEIHVPEVCTGIVRTMRQGMILVTGPTGSGKSTTLAAWVRDLLEMGDSLHILTLENPVEFRYDDVDMNAAYITQRELNSSMKDFKSGIKSALREDPDVILVGEMRDMDTIHLAMEAAETGHLVLGTVHTTDVATTVSRIVQVYPPEQQQAARVQLVGSLRMVVCQRLLPSTDGKRAAAREHLIFTPAIRNELLTLPHERIAGRLYGITRESGVTMGQSITDLYRENKISLDEHIKWMAILQEEKASVLQNAVATDMNFDLAPVDWSDMGEKLRAEHQDVFPEIVKTDPELVQVQEKVVIHYRESRCDEKHTFMMWPSINTHKKMKLVRETPVSQDESGILLEEDESLDVHEDAPDQGDAFIRDEIASAELESDVKATPATPEIEEPIVIPEGMPEEIIWAVQGDHDGLRAAINAWLQENGIVSDGGDNEGVSPNFQAASNAAACVMSEKENAGSQVTKRESSEDIGWATQENPADLVDHITPEPVSLNPDEPDVVRQNANGVNAEKSTKVKKKKKPKEAVI